MNEGWNEQTGALPVQQAGENEASTLSSPHPPQSPGGHGAQRPRAGSPSAEQPILSPSTTALPRWSHVSTSQVRPQGRSQTQDAHSLCCTPAFHLPWGTLPASPGGHSLGRGLAAALGPRPVLCGKQGTASSSGPAAAHVLASVPHSYGRGSGRLRGQRPVLPTASPRSRARSVPPHPPANRSS